MMHTVVIGRVGRIGLQFSWKWTYCVFGVAWCHNASDGSDSLYVYGGPFIVDLYRLP